VRGCWRRERDDGNKVSFFDDAITRRRARRAALGGEVEFRCIGHERGLWLESSLTIISYRRV
jgi:hypothetical protein